MENYRLLTTDGFYMQSEITDTKEWLGYTFNGKGFAAYFGVSCIDGGDDLSFPDGAIATSGTIPMFNI